MSIPHEYLQLTLHEALALARLLPPAREPASLDAIATAVRALARRIEAQDARADREQREWLAAQLELATEVPGA